MPPQIWVKLSVDSFYIGNIAQKEDYSVVLSAWYNIDKYSDAKELQAFAALLGIKTLSQSFSGQISS
jgi:hypothetical protein